MMRQVHFPQLGENDGLAASSRGGGALVEVVDPAQNAVERRAVQPKQHHPLQAELAQSRTDYADLRLLHMSFVDATRAKLASLESMINLRDKENATLREDLRSQAAELERATDQVKQTQYELHATSAALETAEEALKPFMQAKQAVSNFSTAARDLQVSSSEARSGRGDTIKNLAEEFPLLGRSVLHHLQTAGRERGSEEYIVKQAVVVERAMRQQRSARMLCERVRDRQAVSAAVYQWVFTVRLTRQLDVALSVLSRASSRRCMRRAFTAVSVYASGEVRVRRAGMIVSARRARTELTLALAAWRWYGFSVRWSVGGGQGRSGRQVEVPATVKGAPSPWKAIRGFGNTDAAKGRSDRGVGGGGERSGETSVDASSWRVRRQVMSLTEHEEPDNSDRVRSALDALSATIRGNIQGSLSRSGAAANHDDENDDGDDDINNGNNKNGNLDDGDNSTGLGRLTYNTGSRARENLARASLAPPRSTSPSEEALEEAQSIVAKQQRETYQFMSMQDEAVESALSSLLPSRTPSRQPAALQKRGSRWDAISRISSGSRPSSRWKSASFKDKEEDEDVADPRADRRYAVAGPLSSDSEAGGDILSVESESSDEEAADGERLAGTAVRTAAMVGAAIAAEVPDDGITQSQSHAQASYHGVASALVGVTEARADAGGGEMGESPPEAAAAEQGGGDGGREREGRGVADGGVKEWVKFGSGAKKSWSSALARDSDDSDSSVGSALGDMA